MKIQCGVSIGELLDKISILMIKKEKIKDPEKSEWIETELTGLVSVLDNDDLKTHKERLLNEVAELKSVNLKLWQIEDDIREKEFQKSFDKEFVELARAVYLTNDKRFELKNRVNELFSSKMREVKSYKNYSK